MHRLIALLSALFLVAGLVNGSVIHAAETSGHDVSSTWLHADDEHDPMASAGGKIDQPGPGQPETGVDHGVPHGGHGCHGHDLGAQFALARQSAVSSFPATPAMTKIPLLDQQLSARMLRPPIA
jgi:hypothetical protein